jgi:hypothetical protein
MWLKGASRGNNIFHLVMMVLLIVVPAILFIVLLAIKGPFDI